MGTLGIIALIVGAISAIVGTSVSASSIHKTNETNRQIAAMQNQWNVEQWQRENAYNDPSQQVQRLAAAGINPSLAVGQSGLVDAGNAQQVHPAAGATMQPFQMDGSALSAPINQAAMIDSQIKANDAYAANQEAQARETETLLPVKQQQLQTSIKEANQSIENMKKQLSVMDANIANLNQNTAHQAFDISHTLFLENLYDKQYQLDLDRFNKYSLPLLKSEILKNKSLIGLNAAEAAYLKSKKSLNDVDLKFANQTLAYRILGVQNEAWLKGVQLDEAKTTLKLLGFDYEERIFKNPWATILSSQSSAPRWVKDAVAGSRLGASLLQGMFQTVQPALDRVSFGRKDVFMHYPKK